MEALFIFIAKSSGLLILFYFAYFFLLRKETFFNNNRWFLIVGLLTSVILPLVVYTEIVWVDPAPVSAVNYTSNYASVYTPHFAQPKASFEINWNMVSLAIYAIGFAAFLGKFGIDFYSLNSVLKGRKVQQQADFKFIDINENIAPFSYFDYIVYNSSLYSPSELESILEHEKVHSDQNHTIDVLISRIFCVLFWFNPIIWLYKKAILQNLEFIADSEASKKIADKKAYQYTLLRITTHETCVAITNHFYQSLIKKRIVMLNKNQSKKRNYWKYYAIIPALVAFVLLFQIKTVAQERENKVTAAKQADIESVNIYTIEKNSTDAEINEKVALIRKNHDISANVSEVKRNSKNEITSIKIELVGKKDARSVKKEVSSTGIDKISIIIKKMKNGKESFSFSGDAAVTINDKADAEDIDADVAEVADVDDFLTPPTPPTMPLFPNGLLPAAPAIDMSKMPQPPVAPKNLNDKKAMEKFEKQMEEFDRKMEAFEPDMEAYEKYIEEIMDKRGANFDKEMEKYDIAMNKYSTEMAKYTEASSVLLERDMKQHEIDMKQHAIDMKQHEKDMKQHAKDMKEWEKDMKEMEKEKQREKAKRNS
ncbi:M56 family metallopeptidase [Flavobacterium hercynium]|uniref:Peptidase M56 n=1 Tax=Flavobacterium hercynium TaxID=387094 RepID=A0A226H9Q6_9FLAO|nr:M56 family metallopeptidase [Flavobacterium hercynium]OXA91003.1 peptidase M56 [Flavobacterium hercynium]SMP36500.1 BlaR1 peptidase M56 [Flavobacterium hercynium]